MLVNLNDLLPKASTSHDAIPSFNVFGYEDAYAILQAAEKLNRPVILACNKDVIEYYGVDIAASMFLSLAKNAKTEVCLHLDHTYEEAIIFQALKAGFSSVMFDGSQLPLAENILRTKNVVQVAHALGASVEGEIGSVPYTEGRDHIKSIHTCPNEALLYVEQSGVDCVAISIGNIHRLTSPTSTIDYQRLSDISAVVEKPLVIHGTSGIKEADISQLKQTKVAKFNIGTSLRMVFGHQLRAFMQAEPEKFDRVYFMKKVLPFIEEEASRHIKLLM